MKNVLKDKTYLFKTSRLLDIRTQWQCMLKIMTKNPKDELARDIYNALDDTDKMIFGEIIEITGGTADKPNYGCNIEIYDDSIRGYEYPESKNVIASLNVQVPANVQSKFGIQIDDKIRPNNNDSELDTATALQNYWKHSAEEETEKSGKSKAAIAITVIVAIIALMLIIIIVENNAKPDTSATSSTYISAKIDDESVKSSIESALPPKYTTSPNFELDLKDSGYNNRKAVYITFHYDCKSKSACKKIAKNITKSISYNLSNNQIQQINYLVLTIHPTDIAKSKAWYSCTINDFYTIVNGIDYNYMDNMLSVKKNSIDTSPKSSSTSSNAKKSSAKKKQTSSSGSNITLGELNALDKAKKYLDYTAFSKSGLIEQLEYEGFSNSEAQYAVSNCGADWYEQAAKKAEKYLEYTSFSRSGLIDQLEFEGFTSSQAEYAVTAVGY